MRSADLLTRLEAVSKLLLAPDRDAMRDCERELKGMVSMLEAPAKQISITTQTRAAIQNVRFLLERANSFWTSRGGEAPRDVQYSPAGLVCRGLQSTFQMEV